MELGLSLGEAPKPFSFMEKSSKSNKGLEFCMGLGVGLNTREDNEASDERDSSSKRSAEDGGGRDKTASIDPPVQLDLLPLAPVPRHLSSHLPFPWPSENGNRSLSPPFINFLFLSKKSNIWVLMGVFSFVYFSFPFFFLKRIQTAVLRVRQRQPDASTSIYCHVPTRSTTQRPSIPQTASPRHSRWNSPSTEVERETKKHQQRHQQTKARPRGRRRKRATMKRTVLPEKSLGSPKSNPLSSKRASKSTTPSTQ